MAEVDISGFDGAVTLPSGHGGNAKGFTVNRVMNDKDVSRYGGDRGNKFRGGTITISGDINVFLRKGAASTSPGFVAPAADGAALTLTISTGCTLIGTAIFPSLTINHTFGDPAVEGTHGYKFASLPSEAWAVA